MRLGGVYETRGDSNLSSAPIAILAYERVRTALLEMLGTNGLGPESAAALHRIR